MLESLRAAVGGSGVDIVTVCPGWVDTSMSEGAGSRSFMVSADEAASSIADGLESGRVEIVFPLPLAAAAKVARLVPQRLWPALWSKNRHRYAG